MKTLFLTASLFFISFASFSQSNDPAWKYAESITEQNLKHTLTIIASEQMEGRETGTEGQRRAAIYISSEFKKMGLKAPSGYPDYQQRYLLYRDSVTNQSLSFGTLELQPLKDFALIAGSALNYTVNNNQIVFAGYGIDDEKYSDYKGKNVKGKIVVIYNGEPKSGDNFVISGTNRPSLWGRGFNRKAAAAMEHGAVGVIVTSQGAAELPAFYTRNTGRSNFYLPRGGAAETPSVAYVLPATLSNLFSKAQLKQIDEAAKEYQPLNKINATSKKSVKISMNKKRFSVYASNVIGYVEGSDLRDEYVMITGHYDHLGMRNGQIYYGADDDGSGTTGVIEIARAFKKAADEGHGPRRTIVFMTVSGEEKGLWGSEYYSEHPIFPLDKTTVDLNTDMIGRIDPGRKYGDSTNYVYVIGNDKLSTDLDPIAKTVNEKYMNMELDFKFNDPNDPERIYYRSDHFNFARKGVPIIFYFDGIHSDYHKPSDTVDKINFDLMLKRVHYTFLTGWEMANRNDMLKRDIPLPEAAAGR